MKRLMPLLLLALFILQSAPAYAAGEEGFAIESAEATLYRDGYAHISLRIHVNETLPEVTVPLLSNVTANLLVLDMNNSLLDYEIEGRNITIFTLGETEVFLECDTPQLLSYDSGVWTFKADLEHNWTIHLPEGAEVIYISDVPDAIDARDGEVVLSLPPEAWEISYVIPPVLPASFEVVNFQVDKTSVNVGDRVFVTVQVRNVGDLEGSYTVQLKANGTVVDAKTVTLGGGEEATVTFQIQPSKAGSLILEVDGYTATLKVEGRAEEPRPETGEAQPETGETRPETQETQPETGEVPAGFPLEYAVALAAAAAGLTVLVIVLRRKRKANVEKILKDAYLREEEKEVLTFLAERGGRAFESEIRKRFPDMPRTSLWRLIRRLEKNEIVIIRKVGSANLVELK